MHRPRIGLLTVGISLSLGFTAFAADDDALARYHQNVNNAHVVVPGQYAVRLTPGFSVDDLHGVHPDCAPSHAWGKRDWVTVNCNAQLSPEDVLQHWQRRDEIQVVQAAFQIHFTATPNDLLGAQWYLRNTGTTISGSPGIVGADLGAVDAWDITRGEAGVVVAVIDSGVYTGHSELSGRIYQPPGEICGNGKDDDGNGYIDDCEGWDVGDDDNDPDPRDLPSTSSSGVSCAPGHGTFIAGQIAARTNNNSGIAGVHWAGKVMPLKMVSDTDCRLTDVQLAEALYYAEDNGAQVINASWTLGNMTTPAVSTAMTSISRSDTLLVIAAGNANRDVDSEVDFPIDFNVTDDIVVAATDHRDRRSSFSNYGAKGVDIGAPGSSIRSLGIDSSTALRTAQGTSFAAPLVAAGAALLWDEYPELTRAQVRQAIIDGSEPISSLDCGSTAKCVLHGSRLYLPGALDEAEYYASTPLPSATVRVDDGVGGDGDGVIERGESFRLKLLLSNGGLVDTNSLKATLVATNTNIELGVTSVDSPPAEANSSNADSGIAFTGSIPMECIGNGRTFFRITLQDKTTGETWVSEQRNDVRCSVDDDNDGVFYPDDCDDNDASIKPGAPEVCNGKDDDCDQVIDGPNASGAVDWYPDADGDGFGVEGTTAKDCDPPTGFGEGTDDCDDSNADVFPGNEERCDELDNDCNGEIDDDPSDGDRTWADADGDGWGTNVQVRVCLNGEPAPQLGDCDDSDASIFPGSTSHNTDCSERKGFLGLSCSSIPSPAVGGGLLTLLLVGLLRRRRTQS